MGDDMVFRSMVADLLHLLEFAEISCPSEGDAQQARRRMADIKAALALAPAQEGEPDYVAVVSAKDGAPLVIYPPHSPALATWTSPAIRKVGLYLAPPPPVDVAEVERVAGELERHSEAYNGRQGDYFAALAARLRAALSAGGVSK